VFTKELVLLGLYFHKNTSRSRKRYFYNSQDPLCREAAECDIVASTPAVDDDTIEAVDAVSGVAGVVSLILVVGAKVVPE